MPTDVADLSHSSTTNTLQEENEGISLIELRAGVGLAAIYGLRMLGLFLVLPVFAIFAPSLPGGNDLKLVGLAIGAYGLTQALLQIAYGAASDRFGRKPVIVFGLLLFALGSVIAAMADDIYWMIAGRIVQGAGAVSAAISALAADLSREQHRTKVMAMIGVSIGLVFALSLVTAPPLYALIGMAGIFWLTAVLALLAIFVLLYWVPSAPPLPRGKPVQLLQVLADRQLARLNFGVFTLHLCQAAMWVLIPTALATAGGLPLPQHWMVYLPALLLSFLVMVPAIIHAERHSRLRPIFMAAVFLLLLVQLGFMTFEHGLWTLATLLTLFFIAFNILEAMQPSLISRLAAPESKGKALGVYNTLQSAGLFLGGLSGGVLASSFGTTTLFATCALLIGLWLIGSLGLKYPGRT